MAASRQIKKGVRLRRRLCRRVVFQGVGKGFSSLTGPAGRRVLKFDSGFAAEGCGGRFAANKKRDVPDGGGLCRRFVFADAQGGGYIAFDGEFYVPPKAASPFHHYRGPPPPWMEGGKCVTCFSPHASVHYKRPVSRPFAKDPPCHGRLK